MNRFLIQIEHADGWRNITTIAFDPLVTKRTSGSVPRPEALKDARRQLHAWSQYPDFSAERLRLVEHDKRGREVAVA